VNLTENRVRISLNNFCLGICTKLENKKHLYVNFFVTTKVYQKKLAFRISPPRIPIDQFICANSNSEKIDSLIYSMIEEHSI
jgi:hypothetical protein